MSRVRVLCCQLLVLLVPLLLCLLVSSSSSSAVLVLVVPPLVLPSFCVFVIRVIPSIWCCPPLALSLSHCSTHDPPHKQLLVRLGVGGVSWWGSQSRGAHFLVSLLVLAPVLSSLPVSVAGAGAVAVGAGAVVVSPSWPPSKLHPLSTPRAVARGRGAGAGLSFVTIIMPGEGGGGLAWWVYEAGSK